MLNDAKFRAKLPFRGRGHADLVFAIGGVFADIDERLDRREVVRVLELGCGYGTVLLELAQRYGQRIDLTGINRRREDGDADILRRNGVERGLIVSGDALTDSLPAIAYGDVADGLPFADSSFDVVYSQVAWLYFGKKVAVLQEISRVLRDDGLAKIDADEIRPGLPPEYQRLVEIWADGRLIPFGDYARRYDITFVPAQDGEYLRFGKAPRFGDDLELVFEVDLSALHAHWDGIKCVYRVKP